MKLKKEMLTHFMDGSQVMVSTDKDVFSGIVTSNKTAAFIIDCLKEETTPDDVLRTADKAAQLSKLSGLPVVWTTVKETLYSSMQNTEGLFPLRLQEKIT